MKLTAAQTRVLSQIQAAPVYADLEAAGARKHGEAFARLADGTCIVNANRGGVATPRILVALESKGAIRNLVRVTPHGYQTCVDYFTFNLSETKGV